MSRSRVLILGMGVSGNAVAQFLDKKGVPFVCVDRDPKLHERYEILSESVALNFQDIDFVVKSPGIPFSHPWIVEACEQKIPVVGEIDLALQAISPKKTLIGVTGSNGKTTTTLATAHVLQSAGRKALAVGNVGEPLIAHIEDEIDIFVVELSSFQLERIVLGPFFERAALLNITPNHLERHHSLNEYCRSKLSLFDCLKSQGRFFTNQTLHQRFGLGETFDIHEEKLVTIFSLSYRDKRLPLFPHDLENFCAAYALADISDREFGNGLSTFQKPPHRIEFVREVNGVVYVNDSKATSIDAVLKAVKVIEGKIILLAGGFDKGGSFSEWIPSFRNKVLKIIAFGQAAARIVRELHQAFDVTKVDNLEQAVLCAVSSARPGEVVLLSPACSSYDQFLNFEERGKKFKELVCSIGEKS